MSKCHKHVGKNLLEMQQKPIINMEKHHYIVIQWKCSQSVNNHSELQ